MAVSQRWCCLQRPSGAQRRRAGGLPVAGRPAGMGAVAGALAKSLQAFGGEIICDADVDRIIVNHGKVRGVALKNGDEYRADIVVSNLDPKRTFLDVMDAGDLPEVIMRSWVRMSGDWRTWRLSPPETVLEPERDYEGANRPLIKSTRLRVMPRPLFRELRDPCIFREDGRTYLFYIVAGERGIAGAELLD